MTISFLVAASLRRIRSARRYKKLDELRAYYLKYVEGIIEKNKILEKFLQLISSPGSTKFRAIEDVLFALKEKYPAAAKELFIRLGYVKFYERELACKNRIKKANAIDKLGRMGIEECIDKISPMLNSDDGEIVLVTIRALANIGTNQALALILSKLSTCYEKRFFTRKSIETELLKFGDRAAPFLIQYGKTVNNPKVLALILDTLSHLNSGQALELAMEKLHDMDPEVRTKALKIIEKFSQLINGSQIKKIIELSEDPVWFVRLHVAKVLGKVNNGNGSIKYLERLLSDKNWQVRDEAATGIIQKKNHALNTIINILKGDDSYAREILLEKIEKTDFQQILLENLSGSDEETDIKSKEILKILSSVETRRESCIS